jgi:hypothetical protein
MSASRLAPAALLVATCAVCGVLGFRWQSLHAAERDAVAQLQSARSRETLATLDAGSLPPNRSLRLCNDSRETATVTGLGAVYWAPDGSLATFNSGQANWHEWTVAPGKEESLALDGQDGSAWSGPAVFYAMDLEAGSHHTLVAGTSDDLRGGCVRWNGSVSQP